MKALHSTGSRQQKSATTDEGSDEKISQNCKVKIALPPFRHFTAYFERGGGFKRGEEGGVVQAEPQVLAVGFLPRRAILRYYSLFGFVWNST